MKNNEMFCDIETGVCGVGEDEDIQVIDFQQSKKSITLYYVTDPICSHCWAIEPVLRRFKEQYGHYFHFQTVLGGLLEKWHDGPIDPANGIYKPADVAGHWREVGEHSRMPIDGSLMIDNPVQSSYPPSRVFKVIQKHHDDALAYTFLRRAREALFAFNQNISDITVLIDIVNDLGLNGDVIVHEAELPSGQELLDQDFTLVRDLGARGFPTIIFVNEENKGVKITGGRSFEVYVEGLKQALNTEELEPKKRPAVSILLEKEKLLFSKEIEVMYDVDQSDVRSFMKKELPQQQYQMKEVLGELYFTTST
ncbi:DsbA family protein [Bacillus safensis]|uniref:DsbA family protein n=1 Tax=Bacillus safensis TaxID=561879 RepID=UPI00227F4F06|nr:DsbA family protein [Bacillus safensis]MCY7475039.1 DsbA family protein [Bacillus safensis]MCY7510804.1 DsbA family protein [Bacillus safensis]MCY7515221.1 DsbA family protein [Bacillus safensis]MEC1078896.1 DsbA family protein [Bacillus safensis]MED4708668.1 DsbA family protein [Bacillus safensis]